MKFFRTALIFLGCMLILTAANAQGPLEVDNPGFEDGDLTGWSVWPTSDTHQSVTADASHEGTYALKMVGASAAVYQTMLPPVPGNVYYAKGYVMIPSSDPLAEGQEIRIEITFFDASWNQTLQVFSEAIKTDTTTDEWFELTIAAPCPEGTVNMNVGFNWVGTGDASTPGSAYCDDLSASCLVIPESIVNLSLEEDELIWDPTQQDWTDWHCWAYEPINIPAAIDSTQSHTGKKSLVIRPQDWVAWGDPWWWGGYWSATGQTIEGPFNEGDPFYMGAWVMTPADSMLFGSVEGYLKMDFKDASGSNIEGHRPESKLRINEWTEPDQWIYIEVWGEAPGNAASVVPYLGLGQYGEAEGVYFADDAIIATAFVPGTPPEKPEIPGTLDIANPGFESGDLSGWSLWPTSGTEQSVTTDAAHAGENALKMLGPSVAVYQTMPPPVVGQAYIASGHVMMPLTDPLQEGQECRIEITFFDASWNHTLQVFSDPVTMESVADEWHELSISAVCPEGTVNMNVGFNWVGTGDASTPGSAYCDDLVAYSGIIPEEIVNLGFEEPEDLWSWDTDAGWASWCYEPLNEGVLLDSTVSHSGTKSRKVLTQDWTAWGDPWNWGAYWGGMSQWVMQPVVEDEWYYVSAWVMTPSGEPLTGNVEVYTEMKYKDENDSNLATSTSDYKLTPNSTLDTWHHIQCFGKAPAGAIAWIECNIYLGQYGEAEGVAYADDFKVIKLGGELTGVSDKVAEIPKELELLQNYPNPFNPSTQISYSLDKAQQVRLTVYNVLGKEVKTLVNRVQAAGMHRIQFDASALPSGIYFYKLATDSKITTKKMLLTK